MYDELNWEKFMLFQASEEEEEPKISIPFLLDTPYLKKDFNLDLVIWNLSEHNLEITKKVVHYVLNNFNKLFETAWTTLYHYLCAVESYPDVAEHTLAEFYEKQIDFESPYYSIQLEINSEHLADGAARYCFVVATVCSYKKWMISDDDMRLYMVDNKCCNADTNNDNMQILNECEDLYANACMEEILAKIYEKMSGENFQYAERFCE